MTTQRNWQAHTMTSSDLLKKMIAGNCNGGMKRICAGITSGLSPRCWGVRFYPKHKKNVCYRIVSKVLSDWEVLRGTIGCSLAYLMTIIIMIMLKSFWIFKRSLLPKRCRKTARVLSFQTWLSTLLIDSDTEHMITCNC